MQAALSEPLTPSQQDRAIAATVQRERGRLLAFIRRWISDAAEAEDVLQETLYELVRAYRMTQPVEQAGAWLARVARNRIIDRFRSKARAPAAGRTTAPEEGADEETLDELLPAEDGGPESAAMREMLLEEIAAGLAQLPPEQREAFVANELEGVSFAELAARTGVSINTLLSRKRYAVRQLRERLQAVWDEWLMP